MFGVAPLMNRTAESRIEVVQTIRRIEQGQRITAEDIIKVQVGSYGVNAAVIKNDEFVIGQYAAVTIVSGSKIFPEMLTTDSSSADSVFRQFDGSQQAMSITIPSFANALSGKLQNGDIVSVIIVSDHNSFIPSELTYVRVITTTTPQGIERDKVTPNDDGTVDLPSTVTLLVNAEQSRLLAFHDHKNKIYLSLVYRGNQETANIFLAVQQAVFEDDKEEQEDEEKVEETDGDYYE
jgi:pilus assembly protein CpaB